MVRRVVLDPSSGPFELPPAQGFAIMPGPDHVSIAVSIDAGDGLPTVVFVPIPRAMLSQLIQELQRVES
jgi:hypothetical protein